MDAIKERLFTLIGIGGVKTTKIPIESIHHIIGANNDMADTLSRMQVNAVFEDNEEDLIITKKTGQFSWIKAINGISYWKGWTKRNPTIVYQIGRRDKRIL